MKPIFVTRLLLGCLATSASLIASTHTQYQSGKLLDVSDDERLDEGTTMRWAVYKVQVGDIVYTARGERLRHHSGDAGHGLVVGDEVQVAVEDDKIFLKRPDGKEIKAKIVKRTRAVPN